MIRLTRLRTWRGRSISPGALAATFFIAGSLGFGVWQLGHGLYIEAKAVLAQHLLNRAWTQTLADQDGQPGTHKPWPWADTWPVAKLELPRLHSSTIVLAGASGEAMAFGPGHLAGTPAPGDPGTSVIAAHRDTHFAAIKDLEPGDEIRVTRADGTHYLFRVSHMRVVRAGASGIDPYAGGQTLALVTCYPFGATKQGPLRYVVIANAAF